MSISTRNPLKMVGGTLQSGFANTGEVPFTRGGQATGTVYSGAIAMGTAAAGTGALASGGSILFISGAGRLNSFTALFPAGVALAGNGEAGVISGASIVLYDSAITARSGVYTDGTIGESGRKILFAWYPPRILSGMAPNTFSFDPKPLDIPFFSGLCAMALSGATGFAISYTPETTT
jgi:hypothetical protein